MEKNIKEKKSFFMGLTVLAAYTIGLIVISCFHELWFDETQAWLIAKCASYKEMLTVVPHYEGHPPLWHLLLSVFAKNGAPVDITLRAVNITFCSAATALLIFRSPFPKAIRYVLPFTYFFFFHYGIYNRPYSITMLAFCLIAITYKGRNVHPLRYILSLILLCLTTAYGIMIAGGLCLVWTGEIITELVRNKKLLYFWKDKRFYFLCLILAAAIALIITITPADDCYYVGVENNLTLKQLLSSVNCYKLVIIAPFESWSGIMVGHNDLKNYPPIMAAELVIGVFLWISLITITAKNKKFFTFFVPYIFITLFMAFKYMSAYHLGIGGLMHVLIFWIILDEKGTIELPEFMKKIAGGVTSPLVKKTAAAGGIIIAVMPVVYSGIACYNDIRNECGMSWAARIIKDNHLENTKIFSSWQFFEEQSDDPEMNMDYMFKELMIPSNHPKVIKNYTYLQDAPPMIQPYFDRNIFMNFNVDCPEDLYMHYKYKEDTEAVFAQWHEKGLPDFIIGYCPIDIIYSEKELEGVKYLPIARKEAVNFYKLYAEGIYDSFYIREDLLDDYPQFKWIDDQTDNHF
ncbi:hypothetical protein [Ruminococcus sp.]|uniref:hypothetical protein n=1 Tax=Ruminococcus sp. TaxID=41978 RepID=UPI002BAF7548|nr:hypothetical protein [Ruminococcus sp.]HNZ98871.1 hypothetical protein [Ruminococcus sp.]HOH86693.1 hypothetical protein [Ruminococcus sp.]